MELKHAEITGPLIDLYFLVYRTLGYGFLERVYANSMIVAGKKFGLEIRKNAQSGSALKELLSGGMRQICL